MGGNSSVNPSEVFVWDNKSCDRGINFYEDLGEYIGIRDEFAVNLDRFFSSVNTKRTTESSFFKAQPLKKRFIKCVKSVSAAEKMVQEQKVGLLRMAYVGLW